MASSSPIEIHRDYNFGTGDIILAIIGSRAASDPKQIVYLKVHQCILRLHSTVFDEMLELPSPTFSDGSNGGAPAVIDGLPVVQLHDEPQDVLNLMKATYFATSIEFKPLMQDTFDFISAVFKLADKYDMERIAKSLVQRVEADWPATLEKWDSLESQIAAMKALLAKRRMDYECEIILDELLLEPAGVIRFGRTHGLFNFLPAAFYHLSRLSFTFDKDLEDDHHDEWSHVYHGGRTAKRCILQAEDYQTLYAGQGAIKVWLHDAAEGPPISRWQKTCEEKKDYQTCQQRWWNKSIRPRLLKILIEHEIDVLGHLQEVINDLPTGGCCTCQEFVEHHLRKLRWEFWDKLPEFFGLPSFELGPSSHYASPF